VEERDDTSSLLTGRHGNSGLGVIERGSSGADGQVIDIDIDIDIDITSIVEVK
jgi:hypothetical protein